MTRAIKGYEIRIGARPHPGTRFHSAAAPGGAQCPCLRGSEGARKPSRRKIAVNASRSLRWIKSSDVFPVRSLPGSSYR
ncbi:hypothetical protein ZWY2020_049062 [Hordeum vulgare]|nr:hypothetical protein ZWY2020_049062 [Hordeum vulgare]